MNTLALCVAIVFGILAVFSIVARIRERSSSQYRFPESPTLHPHDTGQGPEPAVELEFGQDGRATIALGDGSTIADVHHAMARIFLRDLEQPQMQEMERWLGIEGRRPWTLDDENRFAWAFSRFVWGGEDFPPKLRGMSQLLKKAYPSIKGTHLDVEVPHEIKELFREMLNMRRQS